MALTTFILALLGQRSTLSERLVLRETLGVDRMGGLRRITRNIVLVAFLIYLIGAAAIFWRINGLDGMGFSESIWQSLFLSVSAFNNAGFSTGIVPEMSVAGKAILMIVMFIGRLGPLTLALALTPQEHTVYRFVQERVTMG